MGKSAKGTTQIVFRFIKKYTELHTHPPTIREIAEGCFLSTSAVTRHLDRLEGEKKLTREPGKSRAITLLKDD
jgi:SOS-response transcriptional repressor LexA